MRSLSGVTATGNLTIGNYLGAISQWVRAQADHDENFYFVPDLHTLNTRQDPDVLQQGVLNAVAWLLAAGIDPDNTYIYLQSQIPAHSELCWIFNNYVTMGELSRMTQYKEKSAKRDAAGQVVALFTYPVLQAADILLYDADVVPVGEDQVQHIELTRDIAERFNNLYGDTFVVPKSKVNKTTARIMDLQDPGKKMSKSDPADSPGVLRLLDKEEVLLQKIKRAVTDSGEEIRSGEDKPAMTNLLNIYAGVSGKSVKELEVQYQSKGYGEFKQDLAHSVINVLKDVQDKYQDLIDNKEYLMNILQQGKEKAEPIAITKLDLVKSKIGLIKI